jgi:hypothetical protein
MRRKWLLIAVPALCLSSGAARVDAQDAARPLYVARAVGSWVVMGSRGPRPLSALDTLSAGASISVAANARVDTTFELLLRDPRSLRTARWSCKPVGRCSAPHVASELGFEAGTLKTSARTGALFVHLGEDDEERSRVKLVGARGVARDWGLIVVSADAGQLDLHPLLQLADRVEEELVARVCVISRTGAVAPHCRTEQTIGEGDCVLNAARACVLAGNAGTLAIRIDVYPRADSMIAEQPAARAYAVVASPQARPRLMELAGAYMRDIDALSSSISPQERTALEAAAARELALSAR